MFIIIINLLRVIIIEPNKDKIHNPCLSFLNNLFVNEI